MNTSTTTSPTPAWKPDLDEFRRFVHNRVTQWQDSYLDRPVNRSNETVTALAQLRRGLGKPLTAVPELWGHILDGLPEEPHRGDQPTRMALASHAAVTLYALHQQSRTTGMHQPGVGFGQALRSLVHPPREDGPSEESVTTRFRALGTAVELEKATIHARGLISQLRSDDIGLDYAQFASDLLLFQSPRKVDAVRLRWARDFYRRPSNDEQHNEDDQKGQS